MKTLIIWLLVIGGLILSPRIDASDTNPTDNANASQYWLTKSDNMIWPEKIDIAKIPRENMPAKDYPEGNWGSVTNGCQVSLRFDKQTYTNGEPIRGMVLVRNMTNGNIFYLYHPSGNWDKPVGFVVSNDLGVLYIKKETPKYWQGGRTYTLKPQTQNKHLQDLAEDYKFTNGVYSVHAEIGTLLSHPPITNGKPEYRWIMVKSAEVPITITNSP